MTHWRNGSVTASYAQGLSENKAALLARQKEAKTKQSETIVTPVETPAPVARGLSWLRTKPVESIQPPPAIETSTETSVMGYM